MHIIGPSRRWMFALLCAFQLLLGSALAAEKILDTGHLGETPVTLTPYFDFLEDPDQTLTLADVRRPDIASKFNTQTPAVNALSFGYTRSAYWLRLTFNNSSKRSVEHLLEINYARLSNIAFYQLSERGV